mgnify:CR=1 FL=1
MFLIGTLSFWILLSIFLSLEVLLVALEYGKAASILLLVVATFLQFTGRFDFIGLIEHHPLYSILAIVAYFAIGSGWMVAKWFFFYKKVSRLYREKQVQWMTRVRGSVYPSSTPDTVLAKKFLESSTFSIFLQETGAQSLPLKVSEHRGALFFWACWWPLSVPVTLLNDPVLRIFEWIIANLGGFLQNVSDKEFSKYEEIHE